MCLVRKKFIQKATPCGKILGLPSKNCTSVCGPDSRAQHHSPAAHRRGGGRTLRRDWCHRCPIAARGVRGTCTRSQNKINFQGPGSSPLLTTQAPCLNHQTNPTNKHLPPQNKQSLIRRFNNQSHKSEPPLRTQQACFNNLTNEPTHPPFPPFLPSCYFVQGPFGGGAGERPRGRVRADPRGKSALDEAAHGPNVRLRLRRGDRLAPELAEIDCVDVCLLEACSSRLEGCVLWVLGESGGGGRVGGSGTRACGRVGFRVAGREVNYTEEFVQTFTWYLVLRV